MKHKNKSLEKEINNKESNSKEEKEELYKDLYISIWAVYLVLYAILITIEFLYWQRNTLLDSINNTNFVGDNDSLNEVPKKANLIYVITTLIFVGIVWDRYNTVKNKKDSNEKEIKNAYNSLVAILLFLLANMINFDVLNS